MIGTWTNENEGILILNDIGLTVTEVKFVLDWSVFYYYSYE